MEYCEIILHIIQLSEKVIEGNIVLSLQRLENIFASMHINENFNEIGHCRKCIH